MDVAGNVFIEDEERAEVLNAFFTSVFNSQASHPLGAQTSDQKARDGEQNKPPQFRRKQ